MDLFQFYATPPWLVAKLWATFRSRDFKHILEPAAGNGDLARGGQSEEFEGRFYKTRRAIDVIELDVTKHDTLRAAGFTVVGLDFLQHEGGAHYSHVIGNPPFRHGAAFLLKAFDMLWNGEISMLLNAQTIKNPFSAERQRVCKLIEQYGSAEFVTGAFMGPEVDRTTDVEVAVVHLVKPAEASVDWIGPLIASMAVSPEEDQGIVLPGELQLPNSFVETQVAAFRAAVKAMREAAKAEAVAGLYAKRIGETMAQSNDRKADRPEAVAAESIRDALANGHAVLKDRAWTSILRSTDTLSRLSSKVQKAAEAQFAVIKTLDFTVVNVRAFLCGIVESQPRMQVETAMDVFDQVTRFWSENTVFYRGWKSNDKHRTCGRRMRTTRFILPGFGRDSYSRSLSWDGERQLADFDLVFAMLDGKAQPELGLVHLFRTEFDRLKLGERLSCAYFDVRYYRQAGTLHMFPRDKALVDRLNRLVGKHRAWLPPDDDQCSKAFWTAYDSAEKFDRELHAELEAQRRSGPDRLRTYGWDHPVGRLMSSDPDDQRRAEDALAKVLDVVLERRGLLEALQFDSAAATDNVGTPPAPLLLTAA